MACEYKSTAEAYNFSRKSVFPSSFNCSARVASSTTSFFSSEVPEPEAICSLFSADTSGSFVPFSVGEEGALFTKLFASLWQCRKDDQEYTHLIIIVT